MEGCGDAGFGDDLGGGVLAEGCGASSKTGGGSGALGGLDGAAVVRGEEVSVAAGAGEASSRFGLSRFNRILKKSLDTNRSTIKRLPGINQE